MSSDAPTADTAVPATPPAGWYPDPDTQQQRWWDGTSWGPTAPPASAAAPPQDRVAGVAIAALIAAAVTVVGAFGPWITLGILKQNGADATSDAWAFVALGALAALAAWGCRNGARRHAGWLVILGALGLALGIYHVSEISDRSVSAFGESLVPSVGWGLWLCTIGSGLLLLLGVAIAARKDSVAIN